MPRIVTIINAYANKKNKYQMNQKLKNTSYDLPNGFSGVDLHAYIVSIYGHLCMQLLFKILMFYIIQE